MEDQSETIHGFTWQTNMDKCYRSFIGSPKQEPDTLLMKYFYKTILMFLHTRVCFTSILEKKLEIENIFKHKLIQIVQYM